MLLYILNCNARVAVSEFYCSFTVFFRVLPEHRSMNTLYRKVSATLVCCLTTFSDMLKELFSCCAASLNDLFLHYKQRCGL